MVIQNLVVGKGFSGEPVNWKLVRGSQDGTEKGWLFFFSLLLYLENPIFRDGNFKEL